MKKLVLSLSLVAAIAMTSKAQEFGFKKSDVIVEGSFQSSNKNDKSAEVKTSKFNFTPKAGYFVTDKIAVGVELGFGQNKNTFTVNNEENITKANKFAVGVFGRYYFLEVGSRFKTYAEVGVDYNNTRNENEIAGNKVKMPKVNGFGVNGSVGANYFLSKNIAINFAFADVIAYNTSKVDVDGAKSVNEFNTNVNVFNNFFNSAQFGLTFKF